jgi:hypothetical protein
VTNRVTESDPLPTDSVKGGTPTKHDPEAMGATDGNLNALPPGSLAQAIVSSPPFEASLAASADKPETKIVRNNLPLTEDVAAYLTECRKARGLTRADVDRELGTVTLYSWYEGRPAGTQIPTTDHWLKLKRILGMDDRFDAQILHVEEVEATGGRTSNNTGHAKMVEYGTTDGNIGNDTGPTFWTAAREIVAQSYAILRPGGVAVWVLKSFVRAGAIVDFPGDWQRLCEACGFTLHEEIHASLVKRSEQPGLFGEPVVKSKSRMSFFRRLHIKKYPHLAINYEVVLVMRKFQKNP